MNILSALGWRSQPSTPKVTHTSTTTPNSDGSQDTVVIDRGQGAIVRREERTRETFLAPPGPTPELAPGQCQQVRRPQQASRESVSLELELNSGIVLDYGCQHFLGEGHVTIHRPGGKTPIELDDATLGAAPDLTSFELWSRDIRENCKSDGAVEAEARFSRGQGKHFSMNIVNLTAKPGEAPTAQLDHHPAELVEEGGKYRVSAGGSDYFVALPLNPADLATRQG